MESAVADLSRYKLHFCAEAVDCHVPRVTPTALLRLTLLMSSALRPESSEASVLTQRTGTPPGVDASLSHISIQRAQERPRQSQQRSAGGNHARRVGQGTLVLELDDESDELRLLYEEGPLKRILEAVQFDQLKARPNLTGSHYSLFGSHAGARTLAQVEAKVWDNMQRQHARSLKIRSMRTQSGKSLRPPSSKSKFGATASDHVKRTGGMRPISPTRPASATQELWQKSSSPSWMIRVDPSEKVREHSSVELYGPHVSISPAMLRSSNRKKVFTDEPFPRELAAAEAVAQGHVGAASRTPTDLRGLNSKPPRLGKVLKAEDVAPALADSEEEHAARHSQKLLVESRRLSEHTLEVKAKHQGIALPPHLDVQLAKSTSVEQAREAVITTLSAEEVRAQMRTTTATCHTHSAQPCPTAPHSVLD